jgi:hypothetical protein
MTPLVSARNAAQSGKMQPPPQLASTMADLSKARRSICALPAMRANGNLGAGALTGKRLKLAILLAVLPTFIGIAGVIAFGIGLAIYGF